MNIRFWLLLAMSACTLVPRSVCAQSTTKSSLIRSQPRPRIQKLVRRIEATWQRVLKEQKLKVLTQRAVPPPASFDQAQHQLEAELKRHANAVDRLALQNALADLHLAWGEYWMVYQRHVAGGKLKLSGVRMAEFQFGRAYNIDKIRRPEKAFEIQVKLADATYNVTRPEKQKAGIRMVQQAIAHYRETQNIPALADALCLLGAFQALINRLDDAMSCFNEANTLYEKVPGHLSDKAEVWYWIGNVHNARGEYEDQVSAIQKTIKFAQADHSVTGELQCYSVIGWLYLYNLDQVDKALEWFRKAEMLHKRHLHDELIQGLSRPVLTGIGYAQVKREKYSAATSILMPLLAQARKADDPDTETLCLLILGDMYLRTKRYVESSRYSQMAATRYRDLGAPPMEAISLYRVGRSYMNLGRSSEALRFFNRALQLHHKAQSILDEAATLGALCTLYAQQKQPKIAILYGKQAVNLIQFIRSRIVKLDQSTRNDFLKSNEDTYRALARLLIEAGRYEEADKVSQMLKQNEFDQFVRRLPRGPQVEQVNIDLNKQEKLIVEKRSLLLENISKLSGEMWTLQQKEHLTPEQKARLVAVKYKIKKIEEDIEGLFRNIKLPEHDNFSNLGDTQNFVRALGGHVAQVSAFVDDKGLDLFVTLPQGATVHLAYPATDAKTGGKPFKAWLSTRIYEFVEAIEVGAMINNSVKVNKLATELNNILSCHGELHHRLEGTNPSTSITTVMWCLTDVLRATPLAALRDKDGYWVEKYQNVLLSTSSHKRMLKDNPQRNWKALGLGVTKAWTVKGERFPPLPGVKGELQAVINAPNDGFTGGVFPGRVLEDSKFNRKSFFGSLLRAPQTASAPWQIIHVASHFKVFDDASESYLLLGDGQALTLSTLQEQANKDGLFKNIDLVTLSACQTAQGADSLCELVVRNGAKSVIGTLWPVADKETTQLMANFYNTYANNKGRGKSAALQQAQIALIHSGKVSARPYFWAPFVLMGNWK